MHVGAAHSLPQTKNRTNGDAATSNFTSDESGPSTTMIVEISPLIMAI